jgi:hypothetical protein
MVIVVRAARHLPLDHEDVGSVQESPQSVGDSIVVVTGEVSQWKVLSIN